MSTKPDSWRGALAERMPESLAREIDIFETQLELRKQDKLEERLFAETRLRRGAYGQRYDNGQRQDGGQARTLAFPEGKPTKGPSTVWDAPGMQRIKYPLGQINASQLETLAEVAEEYSDSIAHITTRQDFQLHYVHLEDTPDLMRRLAASGITTQEACGNSVRNVTACPIAGTCSDESFDVTPYATALTYFLMGHPDAQDFGRKFKVSFSGCKHKPCALAHMHDLGLIATTRNGGTERGFEMYVGGGLGAVPQQAKLLDEFVPPEELLPVSQAICRVFARLGEKKNRARARLKFLVTKLGMDEFKRLVVEERAELTHDPRWTSYLDGIDSPREQPLRPPRSADGLTGPPGFEAWLATNVRPQKQDGYVTAHVTVPLGDLTADQLRGLADLARRFAPEGVRTTVDQNMLLRWIPQADLPELYEGLAALGLGDAGAETISDVVACPGTDTCKLGIASSRGLAGELTRRFSARADDMDPAVRGLTVKASGCFNACGQHHISDIGFYGATRKVKGYQVPHFQVVLGGRRQDNANAYGLAIGAVPSKNVPAVVDRLTSTFVAERSSSESFQDFITRKGKGTIKELISDLAQVPGYDEDRSYYSDWGDPREYSTGDMGTGECAGEVVPLVEFGLAASEREVFEAQELLDRGALEDASARALQSMLTAAKALIKTQNVDVPEDASAITGEFRTRFYDTQLFFDPFAGGKFAHYLFQRVEEANGGAAGRDEVHRQVEEAQLFIEAAFACYGRMS